MQSFPRSLSTRIRCLLSTLIISFLDISVNFYLKIKPIPSATTSRIMLTHLVILMSSSCWRDIGSPIVYNIMSPDDITSIIQIKNIIFSLSLMDNDLEKHNPIHNGFPEYTYSYYVMSLLLYS